MITIRIAAIKPWFIKMENARISLNPHVRSHPREIRFVFGSCPAIVFCTTAKLISSRFFQFVGIISKPDLERSEYIFTLRYVTLIVTLECARFFGALIDFLRRQWCGGLNFFFKLIEILFIRHFLRQFSACLGFGFGNRKKGAKFGFFFVHFVHCFDVWSVLYWTSKIVEHFVCFCISEPWFFCVIWGRVKTLEL